MRRVAAATMAAGLVLVVAACGESGESTADVCERMETEGFEAADRMDEAAEEIRTAVAEEDEEAALVGVTNAQNSAADLVDVLRDGASDAADEELAEALDAWADELETLMGQLDPVAIQEGELPDDSGVQNATEEVEAICADA